MYSNCFRKLSKLSEPVFLTAGSALYNGETSVEYSFRNYLGITVLKVSASIPTLSVVKRGDSPTLN